MARIRTIKPMFWTNESLVELPYEYRLLFIGLWNFADDEGFLENRPKQIKLQVFPGDDVNVVSGIRALMKHSLIDSLSLTVGGKTLKVLRIPGWKDHQVINRPTKSAFHDAYVAYQGQRLTEKRLTAESVSTHGGLTREGKGKEGKGKEVTSVGGGGYLSSGENEAPTTTDLLEPWRCPKHQGVDVGCYACKDAKAAYKALESASAKATKSAPLEKRAAEKRERDAVIAACSMCDERGYASSGKPCHHVESTGMPSTLRDSMKSKPAKEEA